MGKRTMKRKCLVVGIILLFLTIGFSPIINADHNTVQETIDRVPVTILESRPDGTVEKTAVRMTHEQADSFHEELRNAHDLDIKLSIYKKYNLISQDVTVDSLREGMEKRAQEMGLTQNGLMLQFRSNRSLFLNVYRNLFCSVSGGELDWDGFCFPPIGQGFRFLGMLFFITDCYISLKGLLGEFYLEKCLFVKLVGFVGIIEVDSSKWRFIDFDGFCVYVKTLEIPD